MEHVTCFVKANYFLFHRYTISAPTIIVLKLKYFNVCLHEIICDWVGQQIPPCMGVCEFMFTYLCVLLRGPPLQPLIHKHAHTHKQLELNEAELSLVPISLIIINFSLHPNTLINLQRGLRVAVCEGMRLSVRAWKCSCTLADKRCGKKTHACIHTCLHM